MKIIGCDFHPGYQQIAMLDLVTGEMVEKALSHERKEEVRAFYAGLEGSVRVGIEASGQSQWFERMLAELGQQVWIGDAAKIRASCERKQKTDRRDAELLLRLLAEDRFPRIWVPTAAERDGRQLLLHRHKLVRMRTQVKNQLQLQALALNQGVQRKWKLWSKTGRKQLELLPLLPWASRRRAPQISSWHADSRRCNSCELQISQACIAHRNKPPYFERFGDVAPFVVGRVEASKSK